MAESTAHMRDATQIIKEQGGLIFVYHQLNLQFIDVRNWDNTKIVIQFDSNQGNREMYQVEVHLIQPKKLSHQLKIFLMITMSQMYMPVIHLNYNCTAYVRILGSRHKKVRIFGKSETHSKDFKGSKVQKKLKCSWQLFECFLFF